MAAENGMRRDQSDGLGASLKIFNSGGYEGW
jgi:hypothetical protein